MRVYSTLGGRVRVYQKENKLVLNLNGVILEPVPIRFSFLANVDSKVHPI